MHSHILPLTCFQHRNNVETRFTLCKWAVEATNELIKSSVNVRTLHYSEWTILCLIVWKTQSTESLISEQWKMKSPSMSIRRTFIINNCRIAPFTDIMANMAERVIWLFCDIFISYYYLFIFTTKTETALTALQ